MRKFLPFSLPLAIVFVIGLSFYLLETTSVADSSILGIRTASASHTEQKSGLIYHSSFTRRNSSVTTRITTSQTKPVRVVRSNPTATPTPTQKPQPKADRPLGETPTRLPTPTPTRSPTLTPTVVSQQSNPSGALSTAQEYILSKINEYRTSQGLSVVKPDTYSCDFAKVRAEEISHGFNHDGFRSRIDNKTLPYPTYHEITENIAMTSNYKDVVTMWINSPGHAENMRMDTPYVCVAQFTNYFAYEGYRP